jgi:hypothetical protein
VPSAKTFGQTAPFAPLFSNVQDGIQNLQVERLTLPRWRGRQSSIRRYCSLVISMLIAYHIYHLV